MSIASDAWIRRMAKEHGMIEPFVEGQVSKGKISYGVSSYGYDVRVGSKYKIFHNLFSTLVDLKSFDPRSFVDHVGDECIIPPNSFVLAETVEKFRIPRNVLCVCLGKCVTGDTRVVDAETGEWLPISEFAGRRRTVGLDGWMTTDLGVSDFIPHGRKPVFELTTRMGLKIRATENHPFRTFSGWTSLCDLRVGDRIAAARHVPVFGVTPLPEWEAALLGRALSENLDTVDESTSDRCVPPVVFKAPKEAIATFLHAAFSELGLMKPGVTGHAFEYSSSSRRACEDVRHLLLRFEIVSVLRSRLAEDGATVHGVAITERSMLRRLQREIGDLHASGRLVRAGHVGESADGVSVASSSSDSYAMEGARVVPVSLDSPLWDVVESIVPAGEEEVYDLTVPGAENFLANDLVVHNSTYARCGIIVNVTPLEPEWEGIVTIEISNTTPLPAKIYSNEGIAQILFFKADPNEICETSYKDRKGKYQSQAGLTLPKIAT